MKISTLNSSILHFLKQELLLLLLLLLLLFLLQLLYPPNPSKYTVFCKYVQLQMECLKSPMGESEKLRGTPCWLGSIHWWYKIKQTPSCLLLKLHLCFQSCSCQLLSNHFFITTSSWYIAELVFILIHVSGPMMNVSPMLTLLLARLLPSISSWDRKIMTSTVFCLLFYCWALYTGCSRAFPLETVAAKITTISVERV